MRQGAQSFSIRLFLGGQQSKFLRFYSRWMTAIPAPERRGSRELLNAIMRSKAGGGAGTNVQCSIGGGGAGGTRAGGGRVRRRGSPDAVRHHVRGGAGPDCGSRLR